MLARRPGLGLWARPSCSEAPLKAGRLHCQTVADPVPREAPVLLYPAHPMPSVPGARRNEGATGPPTSPAKAHQVALSIAPPSCLCPLLPFSVLLSFPLSPELPAPTGSRLEIPKGGSWPGHRARPAYIGVAKGLYRRSASPPLWNRCPVCSPHPQHPLPSVFLLCLSLSGSPLTPPSPPLPGAQPSSPTWGAHVIAPHPASPLAPIVLCTCDWSGPPPLSASHTISDG